MRRGMQRLRAYAASALTLRVFSNIAINDRFTRGGTMDIGQNTKMPESSFAQNVRGQIHSWTGAASGALKTIKFRARRPVGIRKYAWVIFALLLAAGVIEFNYYQARLTREYLRALLVSTAQTNGDIDALDSRLNQLSAKIEALGAKVDKLPLSSPAIQVKPRPSIFSKPR
jgi:hypothetical protein